MSVSNGNGSRGLVLPKAAHRIGSLQSEQSAARDGIASVNPANAEVLCKLPDATPEVVDQAVSAARQAFEGPWSSTSPGKRQHLLSRLAALVGEHAEELSVLESLDNGVPISIVKRFSVAAMERNLSYYASWVDKIAGEVVPLTTKSALDYALREPYGVVAVLTAYNTPSLFLGSKVGPALATGNTVVIKPSPLASLGALRFAELALEAGLPEGTVNVILGGACAGEALVAHPGVDKVSFTGSRAVGKQVARLAAEHLTSVALELGGKSPNLVFEDAPRDKVGIGAALGAFALSGQACVAGSRLFVQKSLVEEVVASLVDGAKMLPLGDPLLPQTVLGPLVSEAHLQRVEGFLHRAQQAGASIVFGGDRPEEEALSRGYYLRPAIVVGAKDTDEIVQEEVFGPVTAVLPFETEEEAIARANDTRYGLAAAVWTTNLARAHRVASRLRAGSVWVNSYGVVPHTAPFGGFKESGEGREGGRWALDLYTQYKNVYLDLS
jgi:acyl-CoA reductase-like NAD-dependent aldehyde dehydrogenase